jgi:SAM-dependent methyltransferase
MSSDNELLIEQKIVEYATEFKNFLMKASQISRNEAELRMKIQSQIDKFADSLKLTLQHKDEYTLINGRADSVYNRLVIEYEPPKSLKKINIHRNNQNAINQVKDYMQGLERRERHKIERLAGVVTDGCYFIFVSFKEGKWCIEDPLPVDDYSVVHFLKHLVSLAEERALIPENLIEDFGENTRVSRAIMPALYKKLTSCTTERTKALFEQWAIQFSEVCDYEEASKLKVDAFARNFGITGKDIKPFHFFFCLHTYYAAFIKLLAVLIVQYYTMPGEILNLKQAANLDPNRMKTFLIDVENGTIFKKYGILNFIEADFFGWYLDSWDEELFKAWKLLISTLASYSLLTLDVDPDTTRDLLKKLYEQLMPRELRHNLGEYYTPDWLAQYVLDLLENGKYSGNHNKRILDPACGSGTFLVLAIKRMQEYCIKNNISKEKTLYYILNGVVGFDLNPLAVISARTNYLLALRDLLKSKTSEINIPVYLCDSILTPHEGEDLYTKGAIKFNTSVGPFIIPKSLIQANYIDQFASFLEEAVRLNLNREQFIEQLCNAFPLVPGKDDKDIDLVYQLYDKLLSLEKRGVNGIWSRIIKNAFAPLFTGEFDYIVGNPPWINWESLPEQYRLDTKTLWDNYGLFPHGGMDTILGKGKKDISTLMTYVAIDKYLKRHGKLAFLITQSVFKTSGAGQGFRNFRLGPDGDYIKVLRVEDLAELNPFEGASNRTAIIVLKKGEKTEYFEESDGGSIRYKVPYIYWKKTVKGKSVSSDLTLEDVYKITEKKEYYGVPVNEKDPTSSWLTGRPQAIKAVKKALGKSEYKAYEGVNTGGANGVYWVEVVDKRDDGLIIISNITEGTKKEVEQVQAAVEPDLLYPLLRGRDVKRWHAEPSAYIIMVQDPIKRRGIDESLMKTKYPKTYLYLKRFEKVLKDRAAFKRYFTRKDKYGKIYETGPFYSMFDVGDYTFAPYKVVWPNIASKISSSVISDINGLPIIPQHIVTLVPCESYEEAHYICALMNSAIVNFALQAYSMKGGKSFGDPHVLNNIAITKFSPENKSHITIYELSKKAHELAKIGDEENLKEIEEEIDELAARIWGLTKEELREIKLSLEELMA